ncbi:MAG: YdcF family protein [Gammaproteobacteria bacterium]
MLGAGFAILWLFSTRVVADYLSASPERTYLPAAMEAISEADAIIVLGGVVEPALPPRRYVDLSQAADRLLHAMRLYKPGKAPVINTSGGGSDEPQAESMLAFLTERACLRMRCCWRGGAAPRTTMRFFSKQGVLKNPVAPVAV